MKTSVSLWSMQKLLFSQQITPIEAIEKIHEAGAEAVELLDCFSMKFPEVRAKIKALGLEVASFSVANGFFCPPEELEKEIALVKFGVDAAVYFDAKAVRVFIGWDSPDYDMDAMMKQAIEAFKECAAYAESRGVVLCLENHGKTAGKSEQVKTILDAVNSPSMKANTDTGNFLLVDEEPTEAISNLAGNIGLVHFKDLVEVPEKMQYDAISGRHYKGTIIGEGEVDLKSIVQILKDSNYQGYLSIEYEGLEEDILDAVVKSVENTKKAI